MPLQICSSWTCKNRPHILRAGSWHALSGRTVQCRPSSSGVPKQHKHMTDTSVERTPRNPVCQRKIAAHWVLARIIAVVPSEAPEHKPCNHKSPPDPPAQQIWRRTAVPRCRAREGRAPRTARTAWPPPAGPCPTWPAALACSAPATPPPLDCTNTMQLTMLTVP